MRKLNLKQKLLYKSIYFQKPNNLWLANIQFGWLKINSTAIPCFEASATSPKSIRRWGWYSFTSVLNSEFLLLLKLIFPKCSPDPRGKEHFSASQTWSTLDSQPYPSPGNVSLA